MSTQTQERPQQLGPAWAGPLPAAWNVGSVNRIARLYAGGTPDRETASFWEDGTIPWLSSGEVNQGTIWEPSTYMTDAGFRACSAKWIPEGALIIALAGQGKTKGMVAQLAIPSTCNQSMAAIVPSGLMQPRFLLWWLTAHYGTIRNLAGGELRDGLNLDIIGAIPCPVPPINAQRAIADYLDRETARIDALIAARRRMVALVEERWGVVVRHSLLVLQSGARPTMLPLKRRWHIFDCKHRTPAYEAEGYPVVSPGDITPGNLDLSRCTRFVNATDLADLTAGRKPKRGDIIYSRNASIGIAAYVDTDQEFTMGQDVCLITSTDQSQRFLTYTLNSLGLDQLDERKIGSTFFRINISQIAELVVPCPSVSEQEAIANRLDAERERIEEWRASLFTQINLLHERREALITAAVTGQLYISEAA